MPDLATQHATYRDLDGADEAVLELLAAARAIATAGRETPAMCERLLDAEDQVVVTATTVAEGLATGVPTLVVVLAQIARTFDRLT